MNNFKICCKCKANISVEHYFKCSSSKDGLDYMCKRCRTESKRLFKLKKEGKEDTFVKEGEEEIPEKKFVDYLPERLKWKITIQLMKATKGYANYKRNN